MSYFQNVIIWELVIWLQKSIIETCRFTCWLRSCCGFWCICCIRRLYSSGSFRRFCRVCRKWTFSCFWTRWITLNIDIADSIWNVYIFLNQNLNDCLILVVVCILLPMQQSCLLPHHVSPVEKSRLQLLLPQVRPSAHSLSLLQSPSPTAHLLPLYRQHFRMLNQSVPSHPVPVSGSLSGAIVSQW